MPEENAPRQDEEHQKEVSSTQTTEDQTIQKTAEQPKEKVIEPLVVSKVKPNSNFKLFSFTGDHCGAKIMNWIRMYENLAARSDWSEEEMLWNLSSYLEQEAFDFYVEHVLAKNLDWKQAKQLMIKRFDQYELEPFMEFLSHKWTPQIELKEYFQKMRALGYAVGLKEEDIISGLTRGLPVHLRSELSFVTSLQQWVAISFCLQQRLDENSYGNRPWKGRRNNGGRNRGPNKQRSNHQQNQDHSLLASNSAGDSHIEA